MKQYFNHQATIINQCLPPLQQAQRRALEEQHAASPTVKASPGIAASTPPAATPKKAAKTQAAAPAKIPEAVPIAVPIAAPTVEIPKVEPKPVVKEPVAEPAPVEPEAPEPEAVLLEQTPAEIEVEVSAQATEEVHVVEMPPVAISIGEAPVVQEVEPIIPETEVRTFFIHVCMRHVAEKSAFSYFQFRERSSILQTFTHLWPLVIRPFKLFIISVTNHLWRFMPS